MSADTIPSKPALPPLNSPENIQERVMMDGVAVWANVSPLNVLSNSVGRYVIKFVLWGLFSPFSRLRIAARNTMIRDEVQNPSRYGLFVTTLIPVESGSVAVQTISKRGHSPLHQQKV
jgi:hypothetical protein